MEALNKGKVIISTEQTAEGVVLTFSDGSTVTIKNGANGKDGKDGANGKEKASSSSSRTFFFPLKIIFCQKYL